jgi:hypothetical protein
VRRGAARARREGLSTAVSVADLLSASWDAVGEAGMAKVRLPAGFEVTYAGPDGRKVRAGQGGQLDRAAAVGGAQIGSSLLSRWVARR